MNKISCCRSCLNPVDFQLLTLDSFPKAAQYYPEEKDFDKDKGIKLQIAQCLNCGLIQLIGEPVDYYKEVITAASMSKDTIEYRKVKFNNFAHKFNLTRKNVIEIGCGKGDFLDILNAVDFNAVGLEFRKESVAFGRSKGRNILEGHLYDYDFGGTKFHSFVCLNFLEHQPDVDLFLKKLHAILHSDAIGYLTVPNIDYLLETETLYEFVADHLVYFSQKTLERSMETHGFDVLESNIINNSNDIEIVVRKRRGIDLRGKITVDQLCRELNQEIAIFKSNGKKVAVWGAGHRTLALLAISNISDIEFIVDSAPFKHGMYSPVTHHLIVSPEHFLDSDIDVLYVMLPGIYNQEVLRNVKASGFNGEVIILENNKLIHES